MKNLGFLLSVKGRKEVNENGVARVDVPKFNGKVVITKSDVEIVEGLVYQLSDNVIYDIDFTKLTNIPSQTLKGVLKGGSLEGVKCKYKGYDCTILLYDADNDLVAIQLEDNIYYMVQ